MPVRTRPSAAGSLRRVINADDPEGASDRVERERCSEALKIPAVTPKISPKTGGRWLAPDWSC